MFPSAALRTRNATAEISAMIVFPRTETMENTDLMTAHTAASARRPEHRFQEPAFAATGFRV